MKHHRSVMSMHWLMAMLVALAFTFILHRENLDDGSARRLWLDLHRSTGLLILLLIGLRLGIRLLYGREPVVRTTPLLHISSLVGQAAMYVLMLALPLIGWAQSSARAHHFKLFGVKLPSLIPYDPATADLLATWHEYLAWGLAAVVGIHFLAALYHHFIRKDGVLQSMLPG